MELAVVYIIFKDFIIQITQSIKNKKGSSYLDTSSELNKTSFLSANTLDSL